VVWFTDADLRAAAGTRSYGRGLDYVDVVTGVGELPGGVVATVHGTGLHLLRKGGSTRRPDLRALLRERAENRAWYAADTLASVLLDEGEVTQAWRVTQKYPCTEAVALAVATRRAETHPADAIKVYRPLVTAAIALTNNHGYARAAQLLLTMRPMFARTGTDFAAYLAELKETNHRKRNLLAGLARNGL
jgi:uncharacterized Zn finger protein